MGDQQSTPAIPMAGDQQTTPAIPIQPAIPIRPPHRPCLHVHPLGRCYDDLGVFPLVGKQGEKGEKGDTGDVIGGYKVDLKGELDRISDLDDIVDPMQGDMYYIKEDGFYRFYQGDNWIMAIITTLAGKDGKGLDLFKGGKAGDVLVKKSDADYDVQWVAYKDLWKLVDNL